jgi:two-component system cell cycle sensor histidine kinase/response regulator CckA
VLAGGIAHDFNNQLTSIILSLAFALESRLDEDTLERLTEAKRAVDEASQLTRQLLTFAKGGDPVVKTIKLPSLLRHSMNFALHGTSIRGELAIDDGLWPVKVDRGQLSQVIQNLVINGRQAMMNGGKITITSENVYAVRHPSLPKIDGRYVHLAVIDAGTGMSPETMKNQKS